MDSMYVHLIGEGHAVVEYGPISMSIVASSAGRPNDAAAVCAGNAACSALDELSMHMPVARTQLKEQKYDESDFPQVLRLMLKATRALRATGFTPMVAVAGSFAQIARDAAIRVGADAVIVNNGGDISYHINQSELDLGIVSDLQEQKISYQIRIPKESKIEGVATSGLGGRSLTMGVASAVTVFSDEACLADAAATLIANNVICRSGSIKFALAEEMDFFTDIAGCRVVQSCGELTEAQKSEALENGLRQAEILYERHMISGALLFLRDRAACWPPLLGEEFHLKAI